MVIIRTDKLLLMKLLKADGALQKVVTRNWTS